MIAVPAGRAVATWMTAQRRVWSQRPARVLFVGTGLSAFILGLFIASPRTLRPVYRYAVGDFAASAIRAPWDLSIRDDDATARLRDATARHTPPIADVDVGRAAVQSARIVEAFQRARGLIAEADATRAVSEAERVRLDAAGLARLPQARARAADRAVRAATQEASEVWIEAVDLARPRRVATRGEPRREVVRRPAEAEPRLEEVEEQRHVRHAGHCPEEVARRGGHETGRHHEALRLAEIVPGRLANTRRTGWVPSVDAPRIPVGDSPERSVHTEEQP